MACPSCARNRKAANDGLITSQRQPYPLRVQDIAVLSNREVRKFQYSDWRGDRHKLIIFIPEAFTPVCQTELGAMNQWRKAFDELGCDLIACGTDPIYRFKEWFEQEPELEAPEYPVFSSYLLPSKLGVLENGRAKRSSVFVTESGEVVRQEHFHKVGRSFAELHRMLYGYTTDSYCAEGWKSPEDGFLTKSP